MATVSGELFAITALQRALGWNKPYVKSASIVRGEADDWLAARFDFYPVLGPEPGDDLDAVV
jgi:hypothetical protein